MLEPPDQSPKDVHSILKDQDTQLQDYQLIERQRDILRQIQLGLLNTLPAGITEKRILKRVEALYYAAETLLSLESRLEVENDDKP